ncbi:hypothetical protein [Pseudoalteromonas ruthenica]|uniref:hypothetical protein n=1 Tax=Pseudoalteromonas ruthenica TaxID=151081 RepID=UPI0012468E28|nr:hypothetical protein [Pseudoalteromonas ruthenica]
MIKAIAMLLALISSTLISAGPSWVHSIKIDDPKLTVKEAAQQCHKSLINAPELLEAWCEKAYEMGYWSALVPISLHTGDGTRLVAEAKERLKNKEPKAYTVLAWLYGSGQFVEEDIERAISLNKELLNLANAGVTPAIRTSAHKELADLYQLQENWPAVIKHASYVKKHSRFKFDIDAAQRQIAKAQKHTQPSTQ